MILPDLQQKLTHSDLSCREEFLGWILGAHRIHQPWKMEKDKVRAGQLRPQFKSPPGTSQQLWLLLPTLVMPRLHPFCPLLFLIIPPGGQLSILNPVHLQSGIRVTCLALKLQGRLGREGPGVFLFQSLYGDFPGGPVVRSPPANAGDTGMGKIPHAAGQLSLRSTATEATCLEPMLCNKKATTMRHLCTQNEEQSLLAATRESL